MIPELKEYYVLENEAEIQFLSEQELEKLIGVPKFLDKYPVINGKSHTIFQMSSVT